MMLSGKYWYNHSMDPARMARALGRRGGLARARRLTPEERRRIAALGGKARAESLRAARRIADNFRYEAAVRALRGNAPPIRRLKSFAGPLPGIYPDGT
jgi:hypothetical protein